MTNENKEKVLNTANILLISDVQGEYDALVQYGFKNIDYFKSMTRADKYFSKHPEQLEKYHVILTGHQSVSHSFCVYAFELERKIQNLRNRLKMSLYSCKSGFDMKSYDGNISLSLYKTSTYYSIFDQLTYHINNVLERLEINSSNFPKYVDSINPDRLPLPSKKSDLKILYLASQLEEEEAYKITSKLGLNITIKGDNNFSLERYVEGNLGEYDIIIASDIYSDSLLSMNIESTEQCKDTGRDLALLATYEIETIHQFDEDFNIDWDGIGDRINLKYVFGGIYAPNLERDNKEFNVLREEGELEEDTKYMRSAKTNMRAIIEASINLYNEALLKNKIAPLVDLDLKTALDFDNEYRLVAEVEEQRKQEALAPIKAFDIMRNTLLNYLYYKSKRLVKGNIDGIEISEGKNGVTVKNIYMGRVLCALTFKKNYNQDNIRIFEVQTVSKKGTLTDPQIVGLYTRKYETLEGVPDRPDEKQLNAIISIEKKVNTVLRQINQQARVKLQKVEDEKAEVFVKKQNPDRKV